jgi:hypothetical protein
MANKFMIFFPSQPVALPPMANVQRIMASRMPLTFHFCCNLLNMFGRILKEKLQNSTKKGAMQQSRHHIYELILQLTCI